MRLLIIEDEHKLARNIDRAFTASGFAVDCAYDGSEGLDLAETGVFDAILLDLMLPGQSGDQVLEQLRAKGMKTPVLVLTAEEGRRSVTALLNAGADDYVSKPFDLPELIARVNALIRRSVGRAHPVLRIAAFEIDTTNQTVSRDGLEVQLSPSEFSIFEYLGHRGGSVVSRQELIEHLRNFDWDHSLNVIDVHVSNLRKKLQRFSDEPFIETIRYRGYRLRREARL